MKPKLQVLEQEISTDTRDDIEYICITDIARFKMQLGQMISSETGYAIEIL